MAYCVITLDADARRLEQELGNLLGNTCKYSGEGCHVELEAELLPRFFDLGV